MDTSEQNKIVIKLLDSLDDESVAEHFKSINFEYDHDLEAAMDMDVSDLDGRAQVYETTITDVELDEDSILIIYVLSYEAYYGCKDMNYENVDERHLSGTRRGNTFTFDKHVPPPMRTTFEEF